MLGSQLHPKPSRIAIMIAVLSALVLAIPSRVFAFQDMSGWQRHGNSISQVIEPGMEWTEAIASWNVDVGLESVVRVQVVLPTAQSACLGVWSGSKKQPNTSLKGQETDVFLVDTDTFIAKAPQTAFTLRANWTGREPNWKMLSICLSNKVEMVEPAGDRRAWGMTIEAPKRAQMNYPNGHVICSATSTSMVLAYWAQVLQRPILDEDVPRVCAGVYDNSYGGTGNWSFNTSYAGGLPGMRACVSRFWGIGQLERWIAHGLPVVCSVSYDLLQGKGKKGASDGHLVVLVGFTKEGDPVFNDPGRNVVRMTYKREHFEAAWATSGRTVYLMKPRGIVGPENTDLLWW